MLKVLKRSFIVILCVVFSAGFLVGCSKDYVLNKNSKHLNSYNISLDIDHENMTIEGYEEFKFKNNYDTILNELVFHLYPRAFREDASIKPYSSVSEARCFPSGVSFGDITVSKVLENGKEVSTKLVGEDLDKLQINLKNPIDVGDYVTIELYFNIVLPNCTHRFGFYENNINLGNFYPIIAMRENGVWDMTPYYASGDPFYSECANYNVEVKHSDEYQIYTSGNQVCEEVAGNKLLSSFKAKAVRDFAIVLGKNFEKQTINIDDTTINYVGYKGDNDLDKLCDLSKKAVVYFSEIFRDYPYKELNIIKTPFLHGGMEYPGLVMISDTIQETEELYKVIVHEIAHEWWYALVGVNETKHAWIDEGLAEFSTALFFGDNSGYDITYESMIEDAVSSYILYVDVIKSINGKINTKMNLPLNEYVNEYEYTYMIYIKGTILFDELGSRVQKNKLVKALSKITKVYAFKNISEDEFTESIKKYTHIDTDNFFNGFLDGSAIIGKLH